MDAFLQLKYNRAGGVDDFNLILLGKCVGRRRFTMCTEQYGTVTQMCQIRMPDRVKSQCLQALHLEAVMHQIT